MSVFKTTFRVSWVETDAAQVVHFSNYFRYFERAEEEFYRSLGLSFDIIRQEYDIWLPRIEAFARFRSPLKFNDLVEVELRIDELREKSVRYGFKIFNKEDGRLVAEGYMVVVAADKKKGEAIEIPKEIVEKLRPFVDQL